MLTEVADGVLVHENSPLPGAAEADVAPDTSIAMSAKTTLIIRRMRTP